MGPTTCGHLPKIVARRVRSRLPPPPPSRPDARTPGSCRGKRGVFRGFQAISAVTGRAPEKRGAAEARWPTGLQEIVSRAGFRGPGWTLPGHPPTQGGSRIGGPGHGPMLSPDPCKSLSEKKVVSETDPDYVPLISHLELLIVCTASCRCAVILQLHGEIGLPGPWQGGRSAKTLTRSHSRLRRLSFANLGTESALNAYVNVVSRQHSGGQGLFRPQLLDLLSTPVALPQGDRVPG